MNRLTSTYLNQLQLLFWAVLIALAGSHARAASVADLTYINYGTYIEITDCSLTATGELNIPDSLEGLPVTTIGDSAFRECAGLASITLPEFLTTIGSYAFRECDALTSIYIPDSVSSMGSQAFNRCENLQEVRLSESISSIGRNAFGYCYSLESIIIPSGISSLAGNAFLNCSSLRTVFFRGGLPNIGGSAFSGIAPDAVAYHIAGATGLDDPDLAPLTLVDVGQYSPFKEWLTGHGLGHDLDPEVDLSGDGVSVFEAFTQNLDPVARNLSSLSFSTAGDQLAIDYYAMSPWVRYRALQSTNLRDWTDADISITAPDTMGRVTASTPMSGDARFIKMRAEFPVLYVSPGGAGSDYRPNQPGNINDALAAAPPGATIRLLSGTYSRIDVNVSGMPEKPITLISDATDPTQYAIIDGGNTTGEKGNQGMVISNADWLVIENLKFQNCWENIIELDNSSYITVRGCDFKEGKEVVHAKAGTHHVLMEYNTWKQREEIWYEWTWADVHHSEVEDLKHYSGTFYGGPWASDQAYGAAVIRHNQGSHLYNWLAMWSNAPNLQANIEVYGNQTDYVRDNVIEPERYTFNLHVYHNEFNQTAASVFSLLHNEVLPWDDPSMALNGPMYVYGNVGSWDASDPVPPEAIGPYDYQPKYGVVKNCKWFTGEPVKFYHNSWKYNKFGLPNTVDNDRQMLHYNNIGVYDEGYSIRQSMQFAEWGNAFDYDFSDKPWQTHLLDKGQEANGIVAPDPGWIDPANSDYRLQAGSVCIDAGAVIPGFTQSYDGAAPDIGAYEGDKLVEGPPFYVRVPPSLEAPTQVVVEQWDFSGANPETGMNGTTVSTWTTASPNSVPSAGVLRYADTMDSDWGGAQLLPDIDTSAIDQMIWTIQLADLNVSAGSNFRFSTLTSGGGDVRPELELTSWGAGPDYTFSPDMEYNGGTDELGGSHISLTGNQLAGPLTIVATWDFASNTMTLQVGDNAPVSITPTANMAATIGTITGFRMYPDSIAAGDYLDLDSVSIETVTEVDGELGYVEKPRITRHRVAGNQLTLFWSWPLDPSTVQDGQIVITVDGRPVQVTGHSIAAPYRELILTTERSLEGAGLEIDFDTFPTGDNGETATFWGSTLQLDVEASRRINF